MDNLNWITFAFTEELIKIAKKVRYCSFRRRFIR